MTPIRHRTINQLLILVRQTQPLLPNKSKTPVSHIIYNVMDGIIIYIRRYPGYLDIRMDKKGVN